MTRIVSLLPSATEIALALGLDQSLVAVSHSCDFPGPVSRLPRATRTRVSPDASSRDIDAIVRQCRQRGESLYQLDVDLLNQLRPDLIITQALCDVCAVGPDEMTKALPALRFSPKVLTLEPKTLAGALQTIEAVGEAVGRSDRARSLVGSLCSRVEQVRSRQAARSHRPRVAFLEWADPPICGGHWNPELVELAGGRDGLGRGGWPSRTLAWGEILAWQPEVLILACCGFTDIRGREELDGLRAWPGFEALPCARNGRIRVLDGVGHFSRPGPSLVDSLELLEAALG
jgi:iron complex transport system substrate-binding protein